MRILFITPRLPDPPSRDGMSLIAHYLIRQLAPRNEITLWSFADDQNDTLQNEISTWPIKTRLFPKPRHRLIEYYLLHGHHGGWFQYQWQSPALSSALTAADRTGEFDLIVIHTPFLSGYLPAITKTPVVLQAIDCMSSWFRQAASVETGLLKRWHLRLESRKATWVEQNVYSLARAVTLVSPVDADIIAQHLPAARVHVVTNGIDLPLFPMLNEPPDPATVIFSGVMDYAPNVDAVRRFYREVWPDLVASRPTVKWLIVGKNPTADVRSLAAADQRITVTGYVDQLRPYFQRATVVISPLNIGTGFKNKVLEALALGRPMVVSPISLPGTSAADGVHLLVADRPTEWVTKINSLLDNRQEQLRLASNGRRLAENSDWSVVAGHYEQLYQQVSRK